MKVVDFQHKVIHISATISLAFDDLDAVINAFYLGSGDGDPEVVEDANGMSALLSGELD